MHTRTRVICDSELTEELGKSIDSKGYYRISAILKFILIIAISHACIGEKNNCW